LAPADAKEYADDFVVLRPLAQMNIGISIEEIDCKENFILILKNKSDSPACVKPSSVTRLTNDGWHIPEFTQSHDRKELKISTSVGSSWMCFDYCYSSLNITSTEISIFESGTDFEGNELPEIRESFSVSNEIWNNLTSKLNIVKFYSLPDIIPGDGLVDGPTEVIYVTYGNTKKSVVIEPGANWETLHEVDDFLSELDNLLKQYRR